MQHTTTQPKITTLTQTHQSIFKKSTFVIALGVLGSITILAGIVTLISAIILLSNASLPSLARIMLTDAVLDITVGALILASSKAFAKGNMLAIWLFTGSILLDSMYSLIRGYELHYILLGLGFLFIWQMLKFRKAWEAS
jgi:hypothetical protein